jgi:hypothetical protein
MIQNSWPEEKLKTLIEKIVLCDFFFACVKFHENLSLNIIIFSHFVEIAKMSQDFANQNNILLDYYIIHMCIDFTTYARLRHKPSFITKFQ